MKTKLLIGLCAVMTLASITTATSAEEVKNIITRTFPVSKESIVEINNSFGNVVIAQSENSVVDFRIEITGTGSDQRTAQQMADRASVSLSQNGNTVSARSSLESTSQNCKNCNVSINYLVLVPASVYLNLTNKFGNVNVNFDTKLDLRANVQYGNLVTRNLLGNNNNITIKFGNMTLGDTKTLTAECAYGKAFLGSAGSLNLNVSFGGLTASRVDNLTLSTKYSDITVEELGSLSGSAEFSNFKITNLASRFDLSSAKYGSVKIAASSPRLESVRIKASFCNVTIGVSPQTSAQVDLFTRFGNINLSGLNASSSSIGDDKDRFAKSFKGTIGGESSRPAVIAISNSYASITLKP